MAKMDFSLEKLMKRVDLMGWEACAIMTAKFWKVIGFMESLTGQEEVMVVSRQVDLEIEGFDDVSTRLMTDI
jgi:hypothetical protein